MVPEYFNRHKIDPKKIVALRRSFSKWDWFVNRCPRLYALNVLDGQWKDSPAQQKGKQVHSFLEACLLSYKAGGGRVAEVPEGPLEAEELFTYWDRILPIVETWQEILEVETWINDVYGLVWSGKIDVKVINRKGEPEVVDFKTCGSLTYTKDSFEAKNSLQFWTYCPAAEAKTASFIYLPPNGRPKVVSATYTQADLDRHKLWFHHTDKIILDAWERAGGDLGVDRWGAPVVTFPSGEADLSVFGLAPTEMRWCSKRFCDQWEHCHGLQDPKKV
jgi:hypothetical protein